MRQDGGCSGGCLLDRPSSRYEVLAKTKAWGIRGPGVKSHGVKAKKCRPSEVKSRFKNKSLFFSHSFFYRSFSKRSHREQRAAPGIGVRKAATYPSTVRSGGGGALGRTANARKERTNEATSEPVSHPPTKPRQRAEKKARKALNEDCLSLRKGKTSLPLPLLMLLPLSSEEFLREQSSLA